MNKSFMNYYISEAAMSLGFMTVGYYIYSKNWFMAAVMLVFSVLANGLYLLNIQEIRKNGIIILPFWLSLLPKRMRENIQNKIL